MTASADPPRPPRPPRPSRPPQPDETPDLRALVRGLSHEQIESLVASLPEAAARLLAEELGALGEEAPPDPLHQALALLPTFRTRPHLTYLSARLTQAVHDVEAGRSRRLIVVMPPRTGKTTLATLMHAAWVLRRHPTWPVALVSHDGTLAASWGRQVRRWVEAGSLGDALAIAPDAGAVGAWETTEGGRLLSLSTRESFTGRGAKVLIIDDPHKDFVDAHSPTMRQNVWDWWLSVAQTRLEPPSLVVVAMTRWHEDDLVGRLLSREHEGDPGEWEVLRLPALADDPDDPLGRAEGEPLVSPLLDETPAQALARWGEVRPAVGAYTFSAMYQQRPAPARGAIFDSGWWRFWTRDPARATEDGRVVYLEPATLTGGTWCDSWDAAFKGADTSDFVVGQRWVRAGTRRYLIAQQRGRWSFTRTLAAMLAWGDAPLYPAPDSDSAPDSAPDSDPFPAAPAFDNPCGHLVHQRLIEERANGAAIIDVLREQVSGLTPVNPTVSKEARARAVTPEVEAGNVYLPHPADAGNEWVTDLLSELRNFPYDAHDDQVDALTQALAHLRSPGRGGLTVPGRAAVRTPAAAAARVWAVPASRTAAARTLPRH